MMVMIATATVNHTNGNQDNDHLSTTTTPVDDLNDISDDDEDSIGEVSDALEPPPSQPSLTPTPQTPTYDGVRGEQVRSTSAIDVESFNSSTVDHSEQQVNDQPESENGEDSESERNSSPALIVESQSADSLDGEEEEEDEDNPTSVHYNPDHEYFSDPDFHDERPIRFNIVSDDN